MRIAPIGNLRQWLTATHIARDPADELRRMIGHSIYWAKWTMAQTLFHTGLLRLWKRVALRGRAIVLMYHRVLPDQARGSTWSHPGIVVGRQTFEQHMALLPRYFHLLTLDELERHLRERIAFDEPSCLVTFDDGWLDTYTEAWPVLRKHGVPAVVFLPIDYIGTGRMFWQEQLKQLTFEAYARARDDAGFAQRARVVMNAHGLAAVLEAPASKARETVAAAVHSRKYGEHRASVAAIEALTVLLGTQGMSATDGFMTWEMAREMARNGVTFGAHSASHRLMTTLGGDELAQEIEESRDAIVRELGRPVSAFCYPNGDWSRSVANCVLRAGFSVAFSTERGSVGVQDYMLALKRVNVHEDLTASPAMFLSRVIGVL